MSPSQNRHKPPYGGSYSGLLRFIILSLGLFTISRTIFSFMYWDRLGVSSLSPLLIGGLRIDLCLISMFAILPALITTFCPNSVKWKRWESYYYRVSLILFAFFEIITPTFISQYDNRPNRLFFEYLESPAEVSGMLAKDFSDVVLFVILGMAVLIYVIVKLLPIRSSSKSETKMLKQLVSTLGISLFAFILIRGTLSHRPINPSTVAFTSDKMVNTLPLNSIYSVIYALYRMKDEKNAGTLYGSMPEAEMQSIIRSSAYFEGEPIDPMRPSQHYDETSSKFETPPHVVIILEESLGARYVGHLTGAKLTPELDKLSKEAWTLNNLYATGTRSARGIEAVITGFLPTPARAVVKLGLSQNNFFTLANIYNANNYDTTFIYGGEGHFDNMRGFLLGNGFKRIIDRSKFENPNFMGTWGVSDEDMFNRLHQELESATKPQFIFAFSVSNHSPYEYPEGRIEPLPPKPNTVDNAIRYADWSIGQFFKNAKTSKYFDNTIFLIVADHDSRVYGASLIPIKHFHIPGMFLGKSIPPRSDNRLASQIDLAPTLISLSGIRGTNPMLGHDLTESTNPEQSRAIMQYGDNFGYRKNDDLVVLQPHLTPTQYKVTLDDVLKSTPIDKDLVREALAHALWPSWAYKNQRYTP